MEEEDTGIRVRVGAGLVTPEIYADSDGLLTVLMLPSSLPGTPLQPETSGSLNLQYAGFDTRGTLNKGACTQTVVTQSPSGLTFSACPGLVPGTALIGPEGGLAGLMAASLGEGINRYYALTIDEIYDRLMADNSPKAPEGFLKDFEAKQNRFKSLKRINPDAAAKYEEEAQADIYKRFEYYTALQEVKKN